jgi:hypothetical protein
MSEKVDIGVEKHGVGERRGVLPESRALRLLILTLLALTAAVSTYVAVKEAVSVGLDFQWSGAHLLSQHQDPWKTYLDGDPQRQIILGQQPNYLGEFYVLLEPLGSMSFSHARLGWCLLNLAFLAIVLAILRDMFYLDRDHTLLVTLLVLSSTPFRVTMSNGQNGIFTLLMLTIVFFAGNRWTKGLALGISFSKYSFSPLIVLVLLIKRRFGVVLISLIPPVIGLLVVWQMLGGSLWALAVEPFRTSKIAMGPGAADVMTSLETALRDLGASTDKVFFYPAVFGIVSAVVAAIWIGRNRRLDERMQLAVSLVMTLLCFKHVLYDLVVLAVPVAAAVMAPRSRARTIVLLCVVHFWFVTTIVNRIVKTSPCLPEVAIYAVILLAMGIATSRLYPGIDAETATERA